MANRSKDVKNRPAGINDNFEIVAMDINNIVEYNKNVLKANNSVRVANLSTELSEGMSIKAYEGIDYDKIIDFKERKERRQNKIIRKQQKESEEQVI